MIFIHYLSILVGLVGAPRLSWALPKGAFGKRVSWNEDELGIDWNYGVGGVGELLISCLQKFWLGVINEISNRIYFYVLKVNVNICSTMVRGTLPDHPCLRPVLLWQYLELCCCVPLRAVRGPGCPGGQLGGQKWTRWDFPMLSSNRRI